MANAGTTERKTANKTKYVYFFAKDKSEGNATMKNLLGGKGANLAEMSAIGLPVPPGFTISTQVCKIYYENNKQYPQGLKEQVEINLRKLEEETKKKFGDKDNPLLVSVRSGAAVSMPGMMDTVLNLGLNDSAVRGLIKLTNNPRFVWDSYRRFIQMFGNVAMGIESSAFEHELEEVKREFATRKGNKQAKKLQQEALNKAVPDVVLEIEDLQKIVSRYKKVYKKYTKQDFPEDPKKQLWLSINAVFGSWNNPRAVAYRQINEIRGLIGTAVNVQTMVFGNLGEDSGTGVGFTRNPSTGKNELYGEYLMNAQGEDVVAGIRTPLPIKEMKKKNKTIHTQLMEIRKKLEQHYKDMQDFEFTMENQTLYMLQTRNGKRTAQAALKIAVDMVEENLISKETAIKRIDPKTIDTLLHPMLDPAEEKAASESEKIFSKAGLPASPGAAVGQAVFTAEEAEKWTQEGKNVILCRLETSPEDIKGMHAAKGILTARGGMTSHAAVVARGMGKCCVAGAGDITINEKKKQMQTDSGTIKQGDWLSLNGSKGTVYIGKIKTIPPRMTGPFQTLMKWADSVRSLNVRTNADTPADAKTAVQFGAEGIGLCRTEHMFFEGERIKSFRRLIIAAPEVKKLKDSLDNENDKTKKQKIKKELDNQTTKLTAALKDLLPLQRKDFEGIFKALQGRPCTIRLLDPPLHEFLPHTPEGQKEVASAMDIPLRKIKATLETLKELNPMLGHRGCRLGITYPEITKTQTRAIIEAALNISKKKMKVQPEIMVPLVGHSKELELQKKIILDTIEDIKKEKKIKTLPFTVSIGTMIEVPRAAVTADEIANTAEFFSFGTNDLTQMGCGFSRDDAGKFLGDYVKMGIYENDPFQVLDRNGIGKLLQTACTLGRQTRKNIKLGICGEHGGEPKSIEFCHNAGLNYVSCSPFRVPIARLAAAQAALKDR
jgi:pyruvate, orthophosphate dikinase